LRNPSIGSGEANDLVRRKKTNAREQKKIKAGSWSGEGGQKKKKGGKTGSPNKEKIVAFSNGVLKKPGRPGRTI